MGDPCFSVARNKVQNQGVSYPAYIENAFALLSEPGEWFADFESHKLYYAPLPGQELSTVHAVLGTVADGEHSHSRSTSATTAIILLPHSAHLVFHRLVPTPFNICVNIVSEIQLKIVPEFTLPGI